MLEGFSDVKITPKELINSVNELLPEFFKDVKKYEGKSDITKAFNFDAERLEKTYNELCKSVLELQFDDIGLKEKSFEMGNPDFVSEICGKYENIAKVLDKYEKILNDPDATIQEKMSAQIELKRYKGNVAEAMVKEILGPNFSDITDKQRLVNTELGDTKPDIELSNAKRDIQIDSIAVKKGESLGIEVKCGSAEYIFNQMEHINKQIKGLGENALVIVSKDYLDLSSEKRAEFEKILSDNGAGLYMLDVYSTDVMTAIEKQKENENV